MGGKRNRRINPETAHRRFTTLQKDPTPERKATRKYARGQKSLCDTAAILVVLERFATEANGMSTHQRQGRNGAYRVMRTDVKAKSNGLAAWIITQYEAHRAKGDSSTQALARLGIMEGSARLLNSRIQTAVDSGEVGRWCSSFNPKVIKRHGRSEMRQNGPRRAGRNAQRKRWKEQGDRFRAEMESAQPTTCVNGQTKGEIMAEAMRIVRRGLA